MTTQKQLSTHRFEAPAYLSRTNPMLPFSWFLYKKGRLLYNNGILIFIDQYGDELFKVTPKEVTVSKDVFWVTLARMKLNIEGGTRWWVGFYPNMISENIFIAPANIAKIDVFVELIHTGQSPRLANRNDSVYVDPPRSLEIFAYVLTAIVGIVVLVISFAIVGFIVLAILNTVR